jgi:hypothetical protein
MEQLNLDLKLENALLMLEELRSRKTPTYATALDLLITRLPPDCPEAHQLSQHRQDYLDSLEATS